MIDNLSISFVPLISLTWLFVLAMLGLALTIFAILKSARAAIIRALVFLLLILIFANPSILKEKRIAIKNKLLVITDNSSSQQIGFRNERKLAIINHIQKQLANIKTTEPVIVSVNDEKDETRLFSTLKQAVADIEKDALAGVVLVTDGQIHDRADKNLLKKLENIPTHALLTGRKDESDLAVVITEAPRYGMVGDDVKISIRLDVNGENNKYKFYKINIKQNENIQKPIILLGGKEKSIRFKLDHAGDNVFSFSVEPVKGEVTNANNTAITIVKTIRDRLRVLLISGQPHAGERTWRNLLKSDPSVDLVHFTILRARGQVDLTPSYELSLIAFPVHELFQRKIKNFDLIIFDRYTVQGILGDFYLKNIKDYIKNGGALLVSSGPEYTKPATSLYHTILKDALPARPRTGEGSTLVGAYIPKLTNLGNAHPVTEIFSINKNKWGRWFRQVSATTVSSNSRVIMSGIKNNPLLILDEYGKGRIAWIGSDHIWLWTRGFDGGGPQKELLRRLAHWLMKEPELEENRLNIQVKDKEITIKRRAMLDRQAKAQLTMFDPDGNISNIELSKTTGGYWQKTSLNVDKFGLYRFSDSKTKQTAFAVVGKIDVPELQQVVSTDKILKKYISGAILWPADNFLKFKIKQKPPLSKKTHGNDWIAIKENNAYRTVGLESYQLLPPLLAMLIVMLVIIFVWYKEGKS